MRGAMPSCGHNVTPELAGEFWQEAERLEATVAVCTCCSGPAPVTLTPSPLGGKIGIFNGFCKWCSP